LAEVLNMRSGPGTAYEVVGQIHEGEQAAVVACNENCDWLKLADGWISAEFVEIIGESKSLPVVAAQPPPTLPPEPTATLAPEPDTTPVPPSGDQRQVAVNPDCSQFNPDGDDTEKLAEEYVCLTNQGTQAVDMTGWMVRDEKDHSYALPTLVLDPGASVRVRTGCGSNTPQDLFWCQSGSAVWNNDGDTVFLFDGAGNLVTQYSYP
jgi:hypothetical protein